MMVAAIGTGTMSLPVRTARRSRASDSPGTYSITTNSSPSVATTSSVETTFGWRIRAASRASSRNMATNSGSFARGGCSRLMATVLREAHGAQEPADMDRRHAPGRDLRVQRVAADRPRGGVGRRGPPSDAEGVRAHGRRPVLHRAAARAAVPGSGEERLRSSRRSNA